MNTLEDQLKIDEGFRSRPYRCTAGKLTIGYGRNIEDVGISQNEALFMLREDIKKVKAQCHEKISFFNHLSESRQEALVNMAFNLGINGLLKFKKTLALMEKGDFKQASEEVLRSKWALQVGERAKRISKQILG